MSSSTLPTRLWCCARQKTCTPPHSGPLGGAHWRKPGGLEVTMEKRIVLTEGTDYLVSTGLPIRVLPAGLRRINKAHKLKNEAVIEIDGVVFVEFGATE
jgi:hypothetical protein